MFRAILPNGQLECDGYEHVDDGLELFVEDGQLLPFAPYQNLEALLTDAAYESREPSVMRPAAGAPPLRR